jgi:HlyD family type I secretion membrane fusion protein
MAQLPTFVRRRPSDLIAAPISAFESETQAVIQRTAPYSEHAILHVVAAMAVIGLFLMCVLKLDRVVEGAGKILPTSGSLFVRPLDKAIVTAILVRPGEMVKKGQPLATLDPTFATADLKDLDQKQASSQALVARLTAEQAGRPYVGDSSPYGQLQATIWRQRQAEYRQSMTEFEARAGGDQAAIRRSEQDAEAYAHRRDLMAQVEAAQQSLQDKGFGSRARLIQATTDRVEAERLAAQSRNEAAQARQDLASIQAQRAVYVGKWRDDIASQLVEAKNDLADLTQNAAKASRVSALSVLTSPADAVVLSVGKASTGSVIDSNSGASDALFTLNPIADRLEAEIAVAARDIGFIRVGDTVRVKLDAFRYTSHGAAKGVIETISDGAFTETDAGQVRTPYYKVRVRLTDLKLRNVPPSFRLIPGMTLQGDVLIGKRTIMSYLLEGALRTGSEAMREP